MKTKIVSGTDGSLMTKVSKIVVDCDVEINGKVKVKKPEQVLIKMSSEMLAEIEDTLELFKRSEYESRTDFIRAAIKIGINELKNSKMGGKE